MVAVRTFADLRDQNYALGLYCLNCDRWGEADLQRLVSLGKGQHLLIRARFRCSDCGAAVDKQLRPPVPSLGHAVSYIKAPQISGR